MNVPPSRCAEDDSALVQAVRSLGGSSDSQEALRHLKEQGRLEELCPHLQGLGEQVLDSMIDEVKREVEELMKDVSTIKTTIQDIVEQRRKELAGALAVLSPYLLEWWREHLDDLEDTVHDDDFVQGLENWFTSKG